MDITLQQSLAVEGPARTGKTRLLLQRAIELYNAHPCDSILVLCSNYSRKSQFVERLHEALQGGYSHLQVTTYAALVRNTISLFWPCVEEIIASNPKIGGSPVIFPELAGFEASEYIIRKVIAGLKTRQPELFEAFQGTERSLVMQLIRRIRLRSENRLERKDMLERSRAINESCIDDVEKVLRLFDQMCNQLRVFDNSKQIDVFHALLQNHCDVEGYFTQRIRHLVVDDVDETIPAQQFFIKFLAPHLDTLTIAADMQGGTRRGYLNAYPYDWEGLKQLKPDMQVLSTTRQDALYLAGTQLLHNWVLPEVTQERKVLPVDAEIQWRPHHLNRLEMIDQLVQDIQRLLGSEPKPGQEPITPGDLIIVMPRVDALARLQIQHLFQCRGIPLQILTGTQRPTDNPVCRSLLLLLQLVNRAAWQMPLSPLEWKAILRNALRLHTLDAKGTEALVSEYRQYHNKTFTFMPAADQLLPAAQVRYQALLDWLARYQKETLQEQLFSAFSDVVSPQLTMEDALSDVHQLLRTMYLEKVAEGLLGLDTAGENLAAREWLIQVKTGIVADTPNKPREIDREAIVLGTPQKIIDYEIERRIHFWLDISSREWHRTDNAPLYNAWVHSVNWDGDTTQASDSFNQLLTRTRAAHITRTLMLYAQERIYLYSSELDEEGNPNAGLFQHQLKLPSSALQEAPPRAILRPDQERILEYQGGAMAITAVPGAGKTFVNVELLLELIERGIAPNSILVLTYMESAARTLLSRLRKKLGANLTALPAVSTIHSLAFRIITEDDHSVYLGLDGDDISIIDEIEVRETLQSIVSAIDDGQGYFRKVDSVLKVIQYAKTRHLAPDQLKALYAQKEVKSGLIIKFILIYEAYIQTLRRQGKLDFTDLILKAIELLEQYPEIRQKYQNRYQYIIEDEAQDSSLLLQRFINLLKEGHGNLIRTGDTNQSITTTFSTADTSVFRNFIAFCQESGIVVEMNRSGRCASPVIQVANRFMGWASQDEILKDAFQPVEMYPVEGMNPPLLEKIQLLEFETNQFEYAWVISKIKELQAEHPEKSIALLLRGNADVLRITQQLQQNDIKAICLADSPDLNPAFLLVAYVLSVLEDPADNDAMKTLCDHMFKMKLLHLSDDEKDEPMCVNLFALHPEEIENVSYLQLYYNLHDLIRYAFGQDICRLIVRLADMFLPDPQQRSVGYLCALKAQQWVDQMSLRGDTGLSALEWVNQEFKTCIQRNRLPFKVVQENEGLPDALRNRFVQVMTLHKSKGQEFDFVFMPGMTEASFPTDPARVIWGEDDKLQTEIQLLAAETPMDKPQLEWQQKRAKVEEEARLVYVGLTRARQGLYLSCPLKATGWEGKLRQHQPSRYFNALHGIVAQLDIPILEVPAHV